MGWTDLDRYRMPRGSAVEIRSLEEFDALFPRREAERSLMAAAYRSHEQQVRLYGWYLHGPRSGFDPEPHAGMSDQARSWYGRFDAGSPTAVWSRSPMIFDVWERHRRPWWAKVIAWSIAVYYAVKR